MREINISNSRLRLVEIDRDLPLDINSLKIRKVFDTEHFDVFNISELPKSKYTGNLWVVCKTKETFGVVDYTVEERDILLSCAVSCISKKCVNVNIVDTFINAIGDAEILNKYKAAVGRKRTFEVLTEFHATLIDKSLTKYSSSSCDIPVRTSGYGYTVYELLRDLVSDHAYICTSKDVVGKYSIMSRGRKDVREVNSEFLSEDWSKIITMSRNSTRANLSLVYSGKIKIEVPKNEHGVESGDRVLDTLRSVCVIKDGELWTKKICVKVNSKKLASRIRSSKCNLGNLVYTNEFILDLSKIPLINNKLLRLKSVDVAKVVAGYELSKVELKFYQLLNYQKKTGCTTIPSKVMSDAEKEILSDQELYLRSLGIYGKSYYPKSEEKEVEDSYESVNIVSAVDCLPDSYIKLVTRVRQFINSGKCTGYPSLQTFLSGLSRSGDYSEKIAETRKKIDKYGEELTDIRYRLLIGRNTGFTDFLGHYVEDLKTAVKINDDLYVAVSWKIYEDTVNV